MRIEAFLDPSCGRRRGPRRPISKYTKSRNSTVGQSNTVAIPRKRVWAMDHSEATQLIDGQYDQIFAVRDLASHRQLVWCGVPSTGVAEAAAILERLFAAHGAPLVMKCDQGSAFTGAVTRQLLARYGVTPLFSPKRRCGRFQVPIPCHWRTRVALAERAG